MIPRTRAKEEVMPEVERSGRSAWTVLGLVVALAVLLSACASAPHPALKSAAPGTEATGRATVAAQGPVPAEKPVQTPSSISAEALGTYRTPQAMHAPLSKDELEVVESAKTLIGEPPEATVVVNGKEFTLDCIGTVSAIFYRMHIDITKDFPRFSGTGVDCLYQSLKEKGVLHHDKYPRPGDVVIWDNTWDANGNGDRTDDLRTHAGLVLAVDNDGTIHYVHENMHRGVIIEVMNLLKPTVYEDESGRLLNSPMAISTVPGGPRAEHWVSGDLFNAFGDVLRLKNYFRVAESDNWKDSDHQELFFVANRDSKTDEQPGDD